VAKYVDQRNVYANSEASIYNILVFLVAQMKFGAEMHLKHTLALPQTGIFKLEIIPH